MLAQCIELIVKIDMCQHDMMMHNTVPLLVIENFTMVRENSGTTYLDHAGSTLYSTSQLDSVHRHLTANLVGYAH
jgi:hypothetical protein